MARFFPAAAAVLAAMLFAASAPAHTRGLPAAPDSRGVVEAASLEQQLLDAINAVRLHHGLRPLARSRRLSVVAAAHSRSMAEHGYFGHSSYGGAAFWRRIESAYAPIEGQSWSVGENLAWASPELTAARVLAMWLDSPPHRKNLLGPAWSEIGVGSVHAAAAPGVYGGLEVTILTADFGTR